MIQIDVLSLFSSCLDRKLYYLFFYWSIPSYFMITDLLQQTIWETIELHCSYGSATPKRCLSSEKLLYPIRAVCIPDSYSTDYRVRGCDSCSLHWWQEITNGCYTEGVGVFNASSPCGYHVSTGFVSDISTDERHGQWTRRKCNY